jgi:hypothetical protein
MVKLKKNSIRNKHKNKPSQHGLTYQTCNPDPEIRITLWKANKNNSQSPIKKIIN